MMNKQLPNVYRKVFEEHLNDIIAIDQPNPNQYTVIVLDGVKTKIVYKLEINPKMMFISLVLVVNDIKINSFIITNESVNSARQLWKQLGEIKFFHHKTIQARKIKNAKKFLGL